MGFHENENNLIGLRNAKMFEIYCVNQNWIIYMVSHSNCKVLHLSCKNKNNSEIIFDNNNMILFDDVRFAG